MEGDNDIPKVRRDELAKYPKGKVAIVTSKPSSSTSDLPIGSDFLRSYNAWGFLNIKKKPKYFALYISSPEQQIKYFGKIEEIVNSTDSNSPVSDILSERSSRERPMSWRGVKGKKIILLEEDSLVEIEPPIRYGNKRLLGLKYTSLDRFIAAEDTDDL